MLRNLRRLQWVQHMSALLWVLCSHFYGNTAGQICVSRYGFYATLRFADSVNYRYVYLLNYIFPRSFPRRKQGPRESPWFSAAMEPKCCVYSEGQCVPRVNHDPGLAFTNRWWAECARLAWAAEQKRDGRGIKIFCSNKYIFRCQ